MTRTHSDVYARHLMLPLATELERKMSKDSDAATQDGTRKNKSIFLPPQPQIVIPVCHWYICMLILALREFRMSRDKMVAGSSKHIHVISWPHSSSLVNSCIAQVKVRRHQVI